MRNMKEAEQAREYRKNEKTNKTIDKKHRKTTRKRDNPIELVIVKMPLRNRESTQHMSNEQTQPPIHTHTHCQMD